MPPLDDNSSCQIDSLASISQAVLRFVNWLQLRVPNETSLFTSVPRRQLIDEMLEFVLAKHSATSLEHRLIALSAAAAQEVNGATSTEPWATNPFHCMGCAGQYQQLLNEIIDIAVTTKSSGSLTDELRTYDHSSLTRYIAHTKLTWPFSFVAIFDYLGERNTSPAGTVIRGLRADAKSYREHQFELQRADLINRVETSVENLARQVNEMSPEQLRSALETVFILGEEELRSYLSCARAFDDKTPTGNIFERLQTLCPSASPILPAALRLVDSTRNWPLISTLLTILRTDSYAYASLMAAALEQRKRGAVLEQINNGAPSPAGPASPTPEHHIERLRKHAEDNEARRLFLLKLDSLSPQERLRHIIEDDQWPLAAIPPKYADSDAALSLPLELRERLKARLSSAPRGAWAKLGSLLARAEI